MSLISRSSSSDEAAPVEEAGERIVVGQELELALERLALGDVGEHALVVDALPALGSQHALVADPDHSPVLGDHPVLGGERHPEDRVALLLLEHPVAVLGMDAPRPQRRVGGPLLLREAEHPLELRRDVLPGALGPGLGDVADGRELLDQGAVAAFGLLQELLRGDQVADVSGDHHDADHPPVVGAKGGGVEHQLDLGAVLAARGHPPP